MLSGGTALFLVADACFRRILHLGPSAFRAAAAALALATIPLSRTVSALAQLTALTLLLSGSLLAEATSPRSPERQPRR